MLWRCLRFSWWTGRKGELRKYIMRQRKKANRRSSYSEKVKRGTHPYKYPFPTGAEAVKLGSNRAIKYSPPTESDTDSYLQKPRSRRAG